VLLRVRAPVWVMLTFAKEFKKNYIVSKNGERNGVEMLFPPQRAMNYLTIFGGKYIICVKIESL
jgi:hypothetical protein